MLSFFPRGVLDEILNLIESASEGFSSYSFRQVNAWVKNQRRRLFKCRVIKAHIFTYRQAMEISVKRGLSRIDLKLR